jgi:hypothetical protein
VSKTHNTPCSIVAYIREMWEENIITQMNKINGMSDFNSIIKKNKA